MVFKNESDLHILKQKIKESDEAAKLVGVIGLRKLLSLEGTTFIQPCIDAGLIDTFVELLYHYDPKFQFEAAWCICNIASGTNEHVKELLEKNVIQDLQKLLDSPELQVVE